MLLSTHLFPGFPLTRAFIIAVLTLSLFIAACGGGDPAETSVPTDVPATLTPPPATVAPAPTTPPVATEAPGEGAATPESPAASAAVAHTAAAQVPTEAPTEVVASNAVYVLQRSCPEDFRQMLLDYDGVEEFGAEVVSRLSDEFTQLRSDCLAEGWDPEFPTDPEVCVAGGTLEQGISYKKNRRSPLTYLRSTMIRAAGRFSDDVQLQVHFSRVPLLSMVPAVMLPVNPGEVIGGCWSYVGSTDGGGRWVQSLIKYQSSSLPEGGVLRDRDWLRIALNENLRYSYPECDSLLQAVISTQLDSGLELDASGILGLVEEVRVSADGVCDRESHRSWNPAPVDGGVGGCPGTPLPGVQDNGDFVLNWGEHHFDGYGNSACWVRSSEGEWVGYLKE